MVRTIKLEVCGPLQELRPEDGLHRGHRDGSTIAGLVHCSSHSIYNNLSLRPSREKIPFFGKLHECRTPFVKFTTLAETLIRFEKTAVQTAESSSQCSVSESPTIPLES